jgi:hypothetical protein
MPITDALRFATYRQENNRTLHTADYYIYYCYGYYANAELLLFAVHSL